MSGGRIDLAIILAGGKGLRLRPLTEETPKPLLNLLTQGVIIDPIANRAFLASYTILDWQLDRLRAAGVRRAVLAISYMAEKFSPYCGREVRGVRVDCSSNEDPERPLGTWGAVERAIEDLSLGGPAFVLNGDIVTDADLGEMPGVGRLATVMVVRMRSPYGIVDVGMDGLILGFREKPVLPFLMNGGIYRVEDLKELAEWGRG
ncbi:MAG: nucleotidyltransferase family protein, partial [Nitrososphaeria archaeon]